MSLVRVTIPFAFQANGMNVQALVNMLGEEFTDPDRKMFVDPICSLEWEYDDDGDAVDMREDIISSIEAEALVLDPEDPNYCGVRVDAVDDDGQIIPPEEPEEDDKDQDSETDDVDDI